MKKVKEVKLHIPHHDIRIIIEGSEAWLSVDGHTESFHGNSGLLICLIRNRNREVPRSELQKHVTEGTLAKNVPNTLSNIRKKLRSIDSAGVLDGLITTSSARGSSYWAKITLDEEDLVYGEEEDEEVFAGGTDDLRSGDGNRPDVRALTGGRSIRSDFLPSCTVGGAHYPTLESCIYASFTRDSIHSSMIVSAVGGAGKTFSLFHVYDRAAANGICAIYVRADALAEEEHNLLHYIARRYLQTQDYHQQLAAFERFMGETGQPVLLLIDGMNEVSLGIQNFCCQSFQRLQQQYPNQLRAVFTTRFPQMLKARLYHPLEAQLQPLPHHRFGKEKSLDWLSRLHIDLTPLILEQLESMTETEMEGIRCRYDLYKVYFDTLADRASRKDASGWIYHVLAYTAACSMEGTAINNRWLKTLCSDKGEYSFLHSWCAGEEYPLEEPATVEKIKATGFLMKGAGDSYTIHQQYRDYLTVRYALLLMECGELAPVEFLRKIIDVTRSFPVAEDEDQADINLRRHNNMDLGEFCFHACLDWYSRNPSKVMVPYLVQLGIQVAYLYDNVRNLTGLYDLHCRLEPLLDQLVYTGSRDGRMREYLSGYYFCLNKLVSTGHGVEALSGVEELLAFSSKLENLYQVLLTATPDSEAERKTKVLSGLGGIHLARYRISEDFSVRDSCLSHAIKYHTEAMLLRRECGSPRLGHSYTALGTCYYYKGMNYAAINRQKEAANVLLQAAEQHRLAVEQESNPGKHISWTRMAGCWYELLVLTPDSDSHGQQRCRQNVLAAVKASVSALTEAAEESGIIHLSGEIRTLLRDVSRFLPKLRLSSEEVQVIEELCELHERAFPTQKKPVQLQDRIIF